MNNFLDFLSNNYIYFFIGAGILFFALIGLLVDLKKKNNNGDAVTEENIPDISQEVNIPEPVVTEEPPVEELTQEEFNPAPPMPTEELVSNVNSEVNTSVVNNEVGTQVLDTTPVMDFETPGTSKTEDISQPVSSPEELK